METEIKRTCFSCETSIQPCLTGKKDDFKTPPSDATCWNSIGNYGSTVFDGGEFTRESLEMYICDECLKKKAKHVYHYKVVKKASEIVDLSSFQDYLNQTTKDHV
jgi:hypothetical protein